MKRQAGLSEIERHDSFEPIVVEGRNCWRIERAEKAAVVVDAGAYYRYIREAMKAALARIMILGWDFDTRIELNPEDHRKETLGDFILDLARKNSRRRIEILKWSFGAKKQFLRPAAVWMLWKWQRTRAIDFRFDGAHPIGCSHHQKIVVIDDRFAVCGGIDISTARWDTSEHLDDDPRRKLPSGKPYEPWHDATMIMTGEAAKLLGDLGRERWETATKSSLSPLSIPEHEIWPKDLPVEFEDVDLAISRTRAAYENCEEVREIEALYLDMIAAAQRFIYMENQYLTSGKIAAAIARRMEEANPPDIVLVMPRVASGWLEQKAMDAARVRLAREIAKVDSGNRFRIYVPVTKGGKDIYVHAKVAIVDDRFLRVGSSNLNNRSLGLDSECDVSIDAALHANRNATDAIGRIRTSLLAEHLGVSCEAFTTAFNKTGSLVDAIEALRGNGKSLILLDLVKPGPLDEFIADNELLDPEAADRFLEPLSKRGLWKTWAKGKRLALFLSRRKNGGRKGPPHLG